VEPMGCEGPATGRSEATAAEHGRAGISSATGVPAHTAAAAALELSSELSSELRELLPHRLPRLHAHLTETETEGCDEPSTQVNTLSLPFAPSPSLDLASVSTHGCGEVAIERSARRGCPFRPEPLSHRLSLSPLSHRRSLSPLSHRLSLSPLSHRLSLSPLSHRSPSHHSLTARSLSSLSLTVSLSLQVLSMVPPGHAQCEFFSLDNPTGAPCRRFASAGEVLCWQHLHPAQSAAPSPLPSHSAADEAAQQVGVIWPTHRALNRERCTGGGHLTHRFWFWSVGGLEYGCIPSP
jgi:hypothetical protein